MARPTNRNQTGRVPSRDVEHEGREAMRAMIVAHRQFRQTGWAMIRKRHRDAQERVLTLALQTDDRDAATAPWSQAVKGAGS